MKEGIIEFNNNKYKYKFFDTYNLIDLIKNNPKFISIYENNIKKYRQNPNFEIFNLIKEFIYYRPDSKVYYFISYKNNEIISMARLYYYKEKHYGYINMVYTNEKYRGQGICTKTIKFLINISKKNIKKYELEVDSDNLSAIKCYENNNFQFVKKIEYIQNINGIKKIKYYNLMKLII